MCRQNTYHPTYYKKTNDNTNDEAANDSKLNEASFK